MFFHLAVQFSKYSRHRLLAIPENDTGSRRRTVFRPSFAWIFISIIGFRRFLTAFAAIDLE